MRIGDEVERRGEVGEQAEQKQLAAARNARVAHEPGDEHDAVGDEGGERAGVAPPPGRDELANESRPDGEQRAERDEQPGPPAHAAAVRRVKRWRAITAQIASTTPNGQVPTRKP